MLSGLLSAHEPLFSTEIQRLEAASGHTGVDVRLTSEIIGKTHRAFRSLGLDPHDTTGKEVYLSLVELARLHDGFLAKALAVDTSSQSSELLLGIVQSVARLNMPKFAWVMKYSAAKRLLKASPPKRAMRALGYRSLDSMLKREPIPHVFAAIRLVEPLKWQHEFLKSYSSLQPKDFEMRTVELLMPESGRWEKLADELTTQQRSNITHLKELGAILILPLPAKKLSGITLATTMILIHYIQEIRMYSAFFKLHQMDQDFGQRVADIITADDTAYLPLGHQQVHWRVVQRYFGQGSEADHPELFEPHVTVDDLAWRKAEAVLTVLEPALHFWYDMEYVGYQADQGELPISFNLMDVALSLVNNIPYEGRRSVSHMRDALWNELLIRYLGSSSMRSQVLSRLDKRTSINAAELLNTQGAMSL